MGEGGKLGAPGGIWVVRLPLPPAGAAGAGDGKGVPVRSRAFAGSAASGRRGGSRWRVCLRVDAGGVLGAHLEALPPDGARGRRGWEVDAAFRLGVQVRGGGKAVEKNSQHRFTELASDWGWAKFTKAGAFPEGALVEVSVAVTVKSVCLGLDHIGLQNQGATCYLNSLLQMFYHLPSLRRSIYLQEAQGQKVASEAGEGETQKDTEKTAFFGSPAEEDEGAGDEGANEGSLKVVKALQELFVQMQTSTQAPTTRALTRSFGWSSDEAFKQHDIQELNRVLCDRLGPVLSAGRLASAGESGGQRPPDEGMIDALFLGKLRRVTRCVDVAFESAVGEDFYDLQVEVKGCSGVEQSLKKLLEGERMEGKNKYQTEEHGLQDAVRTAEFEYLPRILTLHLQRFTMDYSTGQVDKINDCYSFPDMLVVPGGPGGTGRQYRLHSVFVHRGTAESGHYFVFVRPDPQGEWHKFDDSHVVEVSAEAAVEGNYGGKGNENAYMLSYVAEDCAEAVLGPVDAADIPRRLRSQVGMASPDVKGGRGELLRLNVATMPEPGASVSLDAACRLSLPLELELPQQAQIAHLLSAVEENLSIPIEDQLIWMCSLRQNMSARPSQVVCGSVPDHVTLEGLRVRAIGPTAPGDAPLSLLVQSCRDGYKEPAKGDISLILKHFSEDGGLTFVSFRNYGVNCTIAEVLEANEGVIGPLGTVKAFEEVRHRPELVMLEAENEHTLEEDAELEHGDILCVADRDFSEDSLAAAINESLQRRNAKKRKSE